MTTTDTTLWGTSYGNARHRVSPGSGADIRRPRGERYATALCGQCLSFFSDDDPSVMRRKPCKRCERKAAESSREDQP